MIIMHLTIPSNLPQEGRENFGVEHQSGSPPHYLQIGTGSQYFLTNSYKPVLVFHLIKDVSDCRLHECECMSVECKNTEVPKDRIPASPQWEHFCGHN